MSRRETAVVGPEVGVVELELERRDQDVLPPYPLSQRRVLL